MDHRFPFSSPMKTLIFEIPIRLLDHRFPASTLLFQFPSPCRKIRCSLPIFPRNCHGSCRIPSFSCSAASSSTDSIVFGGWDDPRLAGDSQQLRNLLVSLGIDDRKYVLMFLLGLVCALAISKVRVSSIIMFPASVIVFAVGISIGFARGSSTQFRRSSKDENFRVDRETLASLVDFFNVLDGKVSGLKDGIEKAIGYEETTVSDLSSYVKAMESIRLTVLSARQVLEGSVEGIGLSKFMAQSNGVEEKHKPSKRKKEIHNHYFSWLKFFGFLLGEGFLHSKNNKMKDTSGQESPVTNLNNEGNANESPPKESCDPNAMCEGTISNILDFSPSTTNKPDVDQDIEKKLGNHNGRIKTVPENRNLGEETAGSGEIPIGTEHCSYQNNRLHFMEDHQVYRETETYDGLLDSIDLTLSMKRAKMGASIREEQMLKNSDGACMTHHRKEEINRGNYASSWRRERVNHEDGVHLFNKRFLDDREINSSPSSVVEDDAVFERYLTEADCYLKQARECLQNTTGHKRRAEILLYKSSKLLSKAVGLKPMSLLAVGQLGNTYLLHGELKLKISRSLRSKLSRSDHLLSEMQILGGIDNQITSKEEIVSNLVNVCEECEELLVDAGRKYKVALSIDGNDVRALYNWGLALSFRAQLLSDIGPEAALDADKVFLAAIDKFDAMMSRSNTYAPDALFRWGMALQQRSHLRPENSKEKMKLLQQAKRLYEDALNMNSENLEMVMTAAPQGDALVAVPRSCT